MPKQLRNISDSALEVPVLGRTVEVDEVVDVPEDTFKDHVWPESLWAVVSGSAPARKTKDEE